MSDSSLFDRLRAALGERHAALQASHERALTGLRAEKPSDDPVAVALARRERGTVVRHDGHLRAAQSALGELAHADTTLGDAQQAVLTARDLAIAGATDTLTVQDRALLADQVDGLREQVLSLANARHGDRYLFAGYRDASPAFDATGAYVGDAAGREVEVSPGVRIAVGVTGDRTFAPAGGVDVLASLANLSAALRADDTAAVRVEMDQLSAGAQQLADGRAGVGSLMQLAETSVAIAERTRDRATERGSELVEIDAAQAYSDLTRAQAALDAAVAIASQLPPAGLIANRR